MPQSVTLATTQHGWHDRPVEADPYGYSFSFDAALTAARDAVDG
jgi:hypothetical protein